MFEVKYNGLDGKTVHYWPCYADNKLQALQFFRFWFGKERQILNIN